MQFLCVFWCLAGSYKSLEDAGTYVVFPDVRLSVMCYTTLGLRQLEPYQVVDSYSLLSTSPNSCLLVREE